MPHDPALGPMASAVDGLAVGSGQAGGRAVPQVRAVAIEQQDGGQHASLGVLLHELGHEAVEDERQGGAARDELQQPRLRRPRALCERLRSLMSRGDRRDADELAGGVEDGRDCRFDVDPPAVLAHAHGLERLHDLAAAQVLVVRTSTSPLSGTTRSATDRPSISSAL